MKVLQFAFGGGRDNPYLPHNYADPNCVVYTGTHDNDTTRGWFANASESEREYVRRYSGATALRLPQDLMRLALSSIANTAIVPLPDVLDLGTEARMNTPGAPEGNWRWRVQADQLDPARADCLAELTTTYGRSARRHVSSAKGGSVSRGSDGTLRLRRHYGPRCMPCLGRAVAFPGPDDPLWYKDAILYELHVKAFFDSNDDGIGDFRGLIEKLDYLQDLGVTACGCCRPTRRRCATTATTSPTTSTSSPPTATSTTSRRSSRRPTAAACASSPSW